MCQWKSAICCFICFNLSKMSAGFYFINDFELSWGIYGLRRHCFSCGGQTLRRKDFGLFKYSWLKHYVFMYKCRVNPPPPKLERILSLMQIEKLEQSTRVVSTISSPSITNTGAPQGCVLSPFPFTLYTEDCTRTSPITNELHLNVCVVLKGVYLCLCSVYCVSFCF